MERNEPNPSKIQRFARVLTIAGSDSGGCAGLQADLKTFAALQTHGLCAVTAVTAQDTKHVHSSLEIPEALIAQQIQVVLEDIGADAVKTGMLSSGKIVDCVASQLQRYQVTRLVVDPVMVSTGGNRLLEQNAVGQLVTKLLPMATVVTPNVAEAEVLVKRTLRTPEEFQTAAKEICSMGPRTVVIKGGHLEDPDHAIDLFYDGTKFLRLKGARVPTRNTHGSGCTFAAAIAAHLGKGYSTEESVTRSKQYVQEAIQHSLSLGRGNGPLGHFYNWWE